MKTFFFHYRVRGTVSSYVVLQMSPFLVILDYFTLTRQSCGAPSHFAESAGQSHSWSDVALDHWPTRRYNRVRRRAYLMTGRQACHRGLARHEELKVVNVYLWLPHLFALLRWPESPLWRFWTFEGFPVLLSSSPFCSACASMLRNLPRILAPLAFSKRVRALPMIW